MAFGKSRKEASPTEVVMSPKTITASAVEVTAENAGWAANNFGDGAWQAEAWRFYDTVPELHNVADYIGAACSMVRLYIAEVDEYGVMQGEVGAPSTDKEGNLTEDSNSAVAGLIATMFGGPGGKAEILRNLGTSLTVAGETFLVGRATRSKNPEWNTFAPNQVRIMPEYATIAMGNGRFEELTYTSNMILRVWTPHSAVPWRATSPTQGILIPLRQSQELVRFLSSQLVSRLASASLLPVPADVDFPATDKHAGGWNGLLQDLYEVITSNLQGAGTAAMIAPIIMPLQPEALAAMSNVQPITFESVLSAQAIDLRKELRETIAIGLNVPMEIQLGGRDMNHWSIWWANEEFIIKTIAPLLNRICDALTKGYLIKALRRMGLDPARYTIWYDTAPLSNSANQLVDAKDLYTLGVISAAELRARGNFNEADAPTVEEEQRRFVKEVVLRDPTQFALESVRDFLGIDIPDYLPEPLITEELAAPGPPPPPVPDRAISQPRPGEKPNIEISDSEIIASLATGPSPLLVASDVTVRRALELAGKRMLTASLRGMYADLPAHKMHTKVRVSGDESQLDRILAGAWDHVDEAFEDIADPARMKALLDRYAKGLINSNMEHNRSLLAAYLGGQDVTR